MSKKTKQENMQFRGIGGEELEELGIEGHEWNVHDIYSGENRLPGGRAFITNPNSRQFTQVTSEGENLQSKMSRLHNENSSKAF